MPDVITSAEHLVINSVPLATPAWRLTSLVPLWSGADVRGRDQLIPGVAGAIAHRRRATATRIVLPGIVFGVQDREGTPYADYRTGLHANIDVLLTQIVEPVATAAGTHAATWVRPGTDKTAAVHVTGFSTSDGVVPWEVRFALEISIPAGRFT